MNAPLNKYGEAIDFIEYLLKNQEHLKTALKSLESDNLQEKIWTDTLPRVGERAEIEKRLKEKSSQLKKG